MNNVPVRGAVTIVVWLSYLAMIYVSVEQLAAWAILLAFVLMIPLVVVMGATWNMFGNDSNASTQKASSSEKRKRERLDNVLRDLSDDDLMTLRQRLQDGTIDENVLYDRMVGDDGEIVDRL